MKTGPQQYPTASCEALVLGCPDEKGVREIVVGFENEVLVGTQNVCPGSPRKKNPQVIGCSYSQKVLQDPAHTLCDDRNGSAEPVLLPETADAHLDYRSSTSWLEGVFNQKWAVFSSENQTFGTDVREIKTLQRPIFQKKKKKNWLVS